METHRKQKHPENVSLNFALVCDRKQKQLAFAAVATNSNNQGNESNDHAIEPTVDLKKNDINEEIVTMTPFSVSSDGDKKETLTLTARKVEATAVPNPPAPKEPIVDTDDSGNSDTDYDSQNDNISINSDTVLELAFDGPMQPKLDNFAPRKFNKETFQRDFQTEWYSKYSWLGYSVATKWLTATHTSSIVTQGSYSATGRNRIV
jgi:hypothetical protein